MAFTWQSAGHAFASLFKDVVTVSKKVVTALGGLQNEEKLIESLTSLVSPQAAAVEQIAFGALGELVAAVQATETAAGANGVNVAFDASVVAEVKKLIADFPEVIAQVEAAFGKSSSNMALRISCLIHGLLLLCRGMQLRIGRSPRSLFPILRLQKPKTSWERWPTRCPCGTPMLSRDMSGWRSPRSRPISPWRSRKRKKAHFWKTWPSCTMTGMRWSHSTRC